MQSKMSEACAPACGTHDSPNIHDGTISATFCPHFLYIMLYVSRHASSTSNSISMHYQADIKAMAGGNGRLIERAVIKSRNMAGDRQADPPSSRNGAALHTVNAHLNSFSLPSQRDNNVHSLLLRLHPYAQYFAAGYSIGSQLLQLAALCNERVALRVAITILLVASSPCQPLSSPPPAFSPLHHSQLVYLYATLISFAATFRFHHT